MSDKQVRRHRHQVSRAIDEVMVDPDETENDEPENDVETGQLIGEGETAEILILDDAIFPCHNEYEDQVMKARADDDDDDPSIISELPEHVNVRRRSSRRVINSNIIAGCTTPTDSTRAEQQDFG